MESHWLKGIGHAGGSLPEAWLAERPYSQAVPPQLAIDELRRCAGTQFDARLVDLFAEFVFPELEGGSNGSGANGNGHRATLELGDEPASFRHAP